MTEPLNPWLQMDGPRKQLGKDRAMTWFIEIAPDAHRVGRRGQSLASSVDHPNDSIGGEELETGVAADQVQTSMTLTPGWPNVIARIRA